MHRRRPSKSILFPRTSAATSNYYGNVNSTSNSYYGSSSNHPIYTRRSMAHLPETTFDSTYLWGYALLVATAILFFGTLYAMIGSKFVPDTQIEVMITHPLLIKKSLQTTRVFFMFPFFFFV